MWYGFEKNCEKVLQNQKMFVPLQSRKGSSLKTWCGSSVGLEYRPVTPGVASSSLVRTAETEFSHLAGLRFLVLRRLEPCLPSDFLAGALLGASSLRSSKWFAVARTPIASFRVRVAVFLPSGHQISLFVSAAYCYEDPFHISTFFVYVCIRCQVDSRKSRLLFTLFFKHYDYVRWRHDSGVP